MRQGAHWPQDSSSKKTAWTSAASTMSTVSFKHHDPGRAEHAAGRGERLEVQRQVDLVGGQEAARGAAGGEGLEGPDDAAGELQELAAW